MLVSKTSALAERVRISPPVPNKGVDYMKVLTITYSRTGSHTFSRYLEKNGFYIIHEPFTNYGHKDINWPQDKNTLSTDIQRYNDVMVWDQFISRSDNRADNKTAMEYLEWISPQVDKIVTLLRKNSFEWALSSLHLDATGEYFDDWEPRKKIHVDYQDVVDNMRDHECLNNYLTSFNYPVCYFEDLVEGIEQCPFTMKSMDKFNIPSKEEYIINYNELKQKLGDQDKF